MFEVQELSIPEVRILSIPRYQDERGFFSETWREDRLQKVGIKTTFVQDNHSFSRARSTVRGLHMQAPPFAQDKLIRVTRGRIYDVVVDIRKGSPTFGKWVAAILSAQDWNQLFVPVGFLHGFQTLEPETEVIYKVSRYYDQKSEGGVLWNDPDLNIDWPEKQEVSFSEKDGKLPTWKDFVSPFEYDGSDQTS